MTGNESSEAKILSFTFDTSVEANAVVSSVPVINDENGTIAFEVENASNDDLKNWFPQLKFQQKQLLILLARLKLTFLQVVLCLLLLLRMEVLKIYSFYFGEYVYRK